MALTAEGATLLRRGVRFTTATYLNRFEHMHRAVALLLDGRHRSHGPLSQSLLERVDIVWKHNPQR